MMSKQSRGFTLIEMAVVLVVIGLLLMVSLPFFTEKISQEKVMKGRENVNALKREIIGYALTYRTLPTLAQVVEFGNSIDSWDNYIAYYPAPNLEGPGTETEGSAICDESTTDLEVDDESDPNPAYGNIAFVIASRGPNFNLQIGDDGQGASPRTITVPEYQDDADINHNGSDLIGDYGPGVTGGWDITTDRDEPFDDIVEYVTLDYLKGQVSCPAEDEAAGPTNAAVTYDNIQQSFPDSDTNRAETEDDVVFVNAVQNEIRLGNDTDNAAGCIWWADTNSTICGAGQDGECLNGTWTKMRSVFKFSFFHPDESTPLSDDRRGGFVYALISTEDGDNEGGIGGDPGNPPCGNGANDAYLGYAGNFNGAGGGSIIPPKFGVEVDVYGNIGTVDDPRNVVITSPAVTQHSPNHIAAVFWGDSTPVGDDNTHADGPNSDWDTDGDGDYQEVATDGFMTNATANPAQAGVDYNWLEDLEERWLRIEFVYNRTTETITAHFWLDDTPNAAFLDVGNDLPQDTATSGANFYEYDAIDCNTYNTDGCQLDEFRFGWTTGTGGSGANTIMLSKFGMNLE